jgi:type I restriction enzyme, S subunit
MTTVSIEDVAEILNGYAFEADSFNTESSGLPVVRIRDVVPGRSETFYSGPYPEEYLIGDGDLLVGMDGEFNLGIWQGGQALLNQRVCKVTAKGSLIDGHFLKHRLSILLKDVEANTPYVTVKHLSSEKLKREVIDLPPLPEQQRIAAILEAADRLRRLRRYALALSEGYLQTVFVEMFHRNAAPDWPVIRVADLAKRGANAIRTGPFGSQLLHSEFVSEGIAVLGIDNAVNNRFTWGKPRFITEQKYRLLKRYTVLPGDVIITIMGTTGRCAVVPDSIPTAINTKHLCCISLNQQLCLPIFLQWCFLAHPHVQQQLGLSEKGAIMPGLNMEIIKDLRFPLPPMDLQQQFASVAHRHDRLRAQQREALRQAEQLFGGLLGRAFRGELSSGSSSYIG